MCLSNRFVKLQRVREYPHFSGSMNTYFSFSNPFWLHLPGQLLMVSLNIVLVSKVCLVSVHYFVQCHELLLKFVFNSLSQKRYSLPRPWSPSFLIIILGYWIKFTAFLLLVVLQTQLCISTDTNGMYLMHLTCDSNAQHILTTIMKAVWT